MKPVIGIIVAASLITFGLESLAHKNLALTQQSGNSAPADPKMYSNLRGMMLQGSRTKFGITPGTSPNEPFGVLMDWGVKNGTVTVVAIVDGNASMYFSSGGGYLGGGQGHESIRVAAKSAVKAAAEVQPLMQATKTYPLPQTGHVNFYALTDNGVFMTSATEQQLGDQQNPFYKLGQSFQDLITEYRLVQPK
jgi:hypothetical protein